MSTLHVVATLTAKPGKSSELRTVLVNLIEPTRKKADCLRYQLFQNNERPEEFVFEEEWKNKAALDAHFETDHIKQALARIPDLLAAELNLRTFAQLG